MFLSEAHEYPPTTNLKATQVLKHEAGRNQESLFSKKRGGRGGEENLYS